MHTGEINNYDDAFRFLLEFVDYEKITKYKYDIATFNLKRVEDLMSAVGDPHRAFRSVHVAGTKGKGSTSAMAQCILTAAGTRTGLYTSPHLVRLEERMTIDGEMMSEAELVGIVNDLVPYTQRARAEWPNESPTYFEMVTAAGFLHFARQKAQYASVEVGMGGRLDATNVISPEVCVITRVDFDHVGRLGNTLDKIAYEKAGIIKQGVPVVCGPQEPEALEVIERVAAERKTPVTLIGRDVRLFGVESGLGADGAFCRFDLEGRRRRYEALMVPLLGAHQAVNAAAAVAAIEWLEERTGLEIDEAHIRRGLRNVRCPARLEVFPGRPAILLDGAHNPLSVRGLCDTLERVFSGRKIILLMGVSRDKDSAAMLKLLLPHAGKVIFSRSQSPRATEPAVLAEMARAECGVQAETIENPHEALSRARMLAAPDDLICITGSFFLAGELRPDLLGGVRKSTAATT